MEFLQGMLKILRRPWARLKVSRRQCLKSFSSLSCVIQACPGLDLILALKPVLFENCSASGETGIERPFYTKSRVL